MLLILVSMIYYVGLMLNWSIQITTVIFVGLSIALCYKISLYKNATLKQKSVFATVLEYCILTIILYFIIKGILANDTIYGHWDAFWFWNYRAKFFTKLDLWDFHLMNTNGKNLLVDRVAHADYPPGLSSSVAFFWKLSNS